MFRCCLPLLVLIASLINVHAQQAPVTVQNVKFNGGVSPYDWNNVVVKIRAQDNPNPEAMNPKFLDNVGVRITLGYLADRREETYFFLQTEVEIATLPVGQDKSFAFWIPYDVMQRGNLRKEPDYWIIELTVDGKAIPPSKDSTSSSLPNLSAAQNFLNRANGEASKTEGILVPYYLSPYGPLDRNPPAFIRKEPK